MALWMVRVGKYGEHEQKFRHDRRIYLTWGDLQDGSLLPTRNQDGVMALLQSRNPDRSIQQNAAWAFQIDRFVHVMKPGDLVACPLPTSSSVLFGRITGDYVFEPDEPEPYRHSRMVEWVGEPILRTDLPEDIKASLAAAVTICAIAKNDAEQRVRRMLTKGAPNARAQTASPPVVRTSPQGGTANGDEAPAPEQIDIAQRARDQIEALVIARFKGKPMERLVAAILRAQGFEAWVSPDGADGGIDILAAPGPLGFGRPRLCVQVKSWEGPVDSPTLDQLVGTMAKVGADQGLLVSWGGFKSSVESQRPTRWFNVRFWNRKDLIDKLLEHYELLDPELRAEIPLRRVWMTTVDEV
jgi:restriction system protein